MTPRCAIWVVVLSTVGCLPLPHVEHDSPEIAGTLLHDGQPAPGVRVLLDATSWHVNHCEHPQAEARTDRRGRFHFERNDRFEPFVSGAESWTAWNVCFVFPDGLRAEWTARGTLIRPAAEELSCKVAGTSSATIRLGGAGLTGVPSELRNAVELALPVDRCEEKVRRHVAHPKLSDIDFL
jgi:hypothetical protein